MERIILKIGQKPYKFDFYDQSEFCGYTVGRAFSNDVIVDDSYIGGKQLIFKKSQFENGFIEIVNCDKTNPILLNNKIVDDEIFEVNSGDGVTIGRTSLFFYSENHPVPEAREFSIANWLHNHKFKPLISYSMLFILFVITFFISYLSVYEEPEWGKLSAGAIFTLITAFVWASCWSLTGRFLKSHHYFFSHLFFSAAALSVMAILDNVSSYFEYFFSSVALGEITDWLLTFLIFGLLIGFNLTLVTHSPGAFKKGFMSSACMLGLIACVVYLMQDEYDNFPSHTQAIKPVYVSILKPVNIEDHVAAYEDLFSKLDSE